MRASRAAGSSVASWNSAVERAWPGWMPRSFGLCPRWPELTGRPGWPPGNSQGDGSPAPVVACPRLPSSSCRARLAAGSGSVIGAVPTEICTVAPLAVTNVAGGEPGAPGDGLRVEQDEQPGEPPEASNAGTIGRHPPELLVVEFDQHPRGQRVDPRQQRVPLPGVPAARRQHMAGRDQPRQGRRQPPVPAVTEVGQSTVQSSAHSGTPGPPTPLRPRR